MPTEGLEPSIREEHGPKPCAYTNSATSAFRLTNVRSRPTVILSEPGESKDRPAPLRYRIRQGLSMCYSVSMKHLSLVLGILLLAGCQLQPLTVTTEVEEPLTYWLNYYPTQCNEKPWGDTLASTAIIKYYQDLGVTIDSIEVNAPPSGFFSCSACGCSTGVQVSLQTDEAGKAILLEHGFTEEELVNENIGIADSAEEVAEDTETGIADSAEEISEDAEAEITEETIEVELSAEDAALQVRAELAQSALTDYYSQHGAYPDSLTDLTVQLDTTGMTYTPIGVTPADYYDLSVEYSTGKMVLNP